MPADQKTVPATADTKPMPRKIFAPGSVARCGPVDCVVHAVTLREGFVGYQIAWWVEKQRVLDNIGEGELISTRESVFLTLSNL